ncbi:MAG: PQQ-binding-like beta-propeller repeat protein [Planctomycetaceae bacterium]|nr:PQQ-binding-like beta-propeller repeat protein [Planctomycetaceae bacterium]
MKFPTLIGISLSLLLAGTLSAGDWPYWRGPETNGISREKNLIDDWDLASGKNVLWTSDIGGRAAPIILNGKVYLNCRTEHDIADPKEVIHAREQVVCWDLNTGKVLWQDVFNVFQTDIPAPRVGWASMVGDTETGNVYAHTVSGLLRCYSGDGELLWERSLSEEFGKISGYGGRTNTPIIDEDRIIVAFFGLNWGETGTPPPKQTFYAFDKKTGQLQWISRPGGRPLDTSYSNATIGVINGQRVLVCGDADGGVSTINARTGESIWTFKMSKRGLNASPVIDGKYVYITHGEDNIDNVEFGRIQCIDATGSGDVTQTHSVWRVDDVKAGFTSPLVKDGILYVVTDTGKLIAYDALNGQQFWQYSLGTVGKGSPVWADGKLYVMEVNGHIHILKPSKEQCESLSKVQLLARVGSGYDEIYASPAIADGKIVLCTRDRMICLGKADQPATSDPIPPLPAEKPAGEEIATLRLIPYEAHVVGSGSVEYELRAYDANGVFLRTLDFELEPQPNLPVAKAQGNKIVIEGGDKEHGGHVVAKVGERTAQARIRYFPKNNWKWDFEGYQGKQVPTTWVNAFGKLTPMEVDGQTVMFNTAVPGPPSITVWLGPPEMKNYTIQLDTLFKEKRRQLPSVGVINQRYTLNLKANTGKLEIETWAPHMRLQTDKKFRSDPNIWYTLKCKVDIKDGAAHIFGKVWKRDEAEPAEWTIEAIDPHANETGSPAIYVYTLADCLIDNVVISQE